MACDMKDEEGCKNYSIAKQRYWVIIKNKLYKSFGGDNEVKLNSLI
jgi:hypothetical protein